jgi:hypothetical protein
MVSGVSQISNSSAAQGVNQNYAIMYQQEVQTMFISHEFKSGDSTIKKELIGNTIYKHVEKIVGDVKAPKITGMLIDLPEAELNYSISVWNNFFTKVQSAFALITESESNAPIGAQEQSSKVVSH